MVIRGGASGGPVVGQNGRAFAVNSTGLEDDFVSFVSPVSEVLDLSLPGTWCPEPLMRVSSQYRSYVSVASLYVSRD